jgi:cephalosporin hydroxylase
MFKKIYYFIRNKILKHKMGSYPVWNVYEGHFKTTYRSIPMLKCPFDYVMYQMIVSRIQPDLIIEIGTNVGGTTLYLADILNTLGKGEIHTIDIDDRVNPLARSHPRIKCFNGGWKNYDLSNTKKFSKILVIDDASHQFKDTLEAMEKFSNVVSIDSYLIIEDGIVTQLKRDKQLDGGPLRAIEKFLETNNNFLVDDSYCDMFGKNATFNTKGYLKRVK